MELAMVSQIVFALGLLGYSVMSADRQVTLMTVAMYILLIAAGVIFFYSLMN